MKIDRVALADLFSPQAMASGIIRQFDDVPIPIPVRDIAHAVGIEKILEEDLESFEGCLWTDSFKTRGGILINKENGEKRKRFTLGHELGHFLLLDHYPENADRFLCTKEDMTETDISQENKRMETEANIFSAHLLMPTSKFRKDVCNNGSPSLATVLGLSEKYKTSKEATANRFISFIEKPCAILFSKDNQIRYINSNGSFSSLKFKRGDSLPNHMHEQNREEEIGTVSEVQEKCGTVWCAEIRNEPLPEYVFEQTIRQQNGYRMTLLYHDVFSHMDEEEEEIDEERDLLESWTPRFHRK